MAPLLIGNHWDVTAGTPSAELQLKTPTGKLKLAKAVAGKQDHSVPDKRIKF